MIDTKLQTRPTIRAASILLEDNRMCIVKQKVTEKRGWSLPGGKLELGEKLSECVAREFEEETGLDVRIKELLYITDRITTNPGTHVVHMVFLVERVGTGPLPDEWRYLDPAPSESADKLRLIRMVPVDELEEYGFSPVFPRLINEGFPERGSYQGNFTDFYKEEV